MRRTSASGSFRRLRESGHERGVGHAARGERGPPPDAAVGVAQETLELSRPVRARVLEREEPGQLLDAGRGRGGAAGFFTALAGAAASASSTAPITRALRMPAR